jgi:malate/lactate dehydrogenase
MGRGDRHPDKDIRKAIKDAQDAGWKIERAKGKGHRWGTASCGAGCEVAIWSTPRRPQTIAKRIREAIEGCQHDLDAGRP